MQRYTVHKLKEQCTAAYKAIKCRTANAMQCIVENVTQFNAIQGNVVEYNPIEGNVEVILGRVGWIQQLGWSPGWMQHDTAGQPSDHVVMMML